MLSGRSLLAAREGRGLNRATKLDYRVSLGVRQIARCVSKRLADSAGQSCHGGNRCQGNQDQEQTVFRQVLAFFFLPQPLKNALHLFCLLVSNLTTRYRSSTTRALLSTPFAKNGSQ